MTFDEKEKQRTVQRLDDLNKDMDDGNKTIQNLNVSDTFSAQSLANNNNAITHNNTHTNIYTNATMNNNPIHPYINNQLSKHNITIINNKQELQLLLCKARDYE